MALTQQKYAKICIELDVSKPFTETLWIGTSKEYGWEVSCEYEGNQAFCDYCGLLGYTIGLCRKKRQIQGKQTIEEPQAKQINLKMGQTSKQRDGERWVARGTVTAPSTDRPTDSEKQNDIVSPVAILKKPLDGILDEVRQSPVNVGLVTDTDGDNISMEKDEI